MINFTFKPLEYGDLPLLYEWLTLPHVAAWWRETTVTRRDYDGFTQKYRKKIGVADTGCFVVYHQQRPIGYIAWSDTATDPIRIEKYPDHTYGMDLFIADREYLGKGYGVEMIKQFISEIIIPMKPNKIIIDPEITNTRAIHVYEKVGFKKTKIVQATDGTKMVTAQLMELDIKV